MNSFYSLNPDPHMTGHFRSNSTAQPNANPGCLIYPNGTGQFWINPAIPMDSNLHFFLPASFRAYLFACVTIRAMTLWVKPPYPGEADDSLILAIAVKKADGFHRIIAWRNSCSDEASAGRLLAQHSSLTGACCGHECSLILSQDGSVQRMADLLAITLTEAIEDAVAVPYRFQRGTA